MPDRPDFAAIINRLSPILPRTREDMQSIIDYCLALEAELAGARVALAGLFAGDGHVKDCMGHYTGRCQPECQTAQVALARLGGAAG